jgi:cell fate regulator YaaT (PSP1 superfamily)
MGGLGVCGRPFCCKSFLPDFVQVSIKMAKEQNLSLNSAKISGACGRLMCCLRYEYDTYLEEAALTPKVDAIVDTPDGEGLVIESSPLKGTVKVTLNKEPNGARLYRREDCVVKGHMKKKKNNDGGDKKAEEKK